MFTEGNTATRSVAENTASTVNIGTPVAATDVDNNTLAYLLSGADAASFSIDSEEGQLKTGAALNYEVKSSYTVTITVTDGTFTDTITVTINVTDANDAPIFTDDTTTTRSVAENTVASQNIGTAVDATDADRVIHSPIVSVARMRHHLILLAHQGSCKPKPRWIMKRRHPIR